MTKRFIDLDADILEKIFFMLSVDDVKRCTEVSQEWKEFITTFIYSQAKFHQRRIERNWCQEDPKYVKTSEVIEGGLEKPFIIAATDKFLVVNEYNELHHTNQKLVVINVETKEVWKTPTIGPTQEVDVPRYFRMWKDYIRFEVHINEDVLALIFANRAKPGYFRLMVFSNVSHRKLYDAKIGSFVGSVFLSKQSVLVVFQKNKLEILQFSHEAFVHRHSCVTEKALRKPRVYGPDNYTVSSSFILFWQSTATETEFFMWTYNEAEKQVKQIGFQPKFRKFANIPSEYHVFDVAVVSKCFILLTHTNNLPRLTNIRVINPDGSLVQEVKIGRYLANSGLLVNERKIFVKTFQFVSEILMMFDAKELCFNGQHEHDIQHTVIEDLRKRDMAYQYYQHYFPEGGRNSGFCVNDSSLSKAAVVINGEKKSIVITKLDFSQLV